MLYKKKKKEKKKGVEFEFLNDVHEEILCVFVGCLFTLTCNGPHKSCNGNTLCERLDGKETGVFMRLRFVFLFFFFLAAVVFDFSTDLLYTFHQLMHCSQQNKERSAY